MKEETKRKQKAEAREKEETRQEEGEKPEPCERARNPLLLLPAPLLTLLELQTRQR